ncbi:hypothetical protein F0U61_08865 [Archangium violaceum]|nr:hypothetical protein F0U61_08865 [Archangium violaceum]
MNNDLLQVDGPLAGPFKTLEELASNACELMTSEPGASNGKYGFEYCALYYYSQDEDRFFLSYLSDIRSNLDARIKSCEIPRELNDPNREDAVILGGAHTHPHNGKFAPKDLNAASIWHPTRITSKGGGRVFDRTMMMFIKETTGEKPGECRAYSYNNYTRTVSALRSGEWIPIGQVYNDDGDLRMFEGKGWLP